MFLLLLAFMIVRTQSESIWREFTILSESITIIKITHPNTVITLINARSENSLLNIGKGKLPRDHCLRVYHELDQQKPMSDCIAGQPRYVIGSGDISIQVLVDEEALVRAETDADAAISLAFIITPIHRCNDRFGIDTKIDVVSDAVIFTPAPGIGRRTFELYKSGTLIESDTVIRPFSAPLDYLMDHDGITFIAASDAGECFEKITLASVVDSLRGNNIFYLTPMIMDTSNPELSLIIVGYPRIIPEPPPNTIVIMALFDNFGQCLWSFPLLSPEDYFTVSLAGGIDDCGVYAYRLEATVVLPSNVVIARSAWTISHVGATTAEMKSQPWSGCHYVANITAESRLGIHTALPSARSLSRSPLPADSTAFMSVEVDESTLPRVPSDHATTVRARLAGVDRPLFDVLVAKLDGREYLMSGESGKAGEFSFQTRYGATHTLSMIGYVMLPDSENLYTLRRETPQVTIAPLPPIYTQLQLPVTYYFPDSDEANVVVDVSITDILMITFTEAPDVHVSRGDMIISSLPLPSGRIYSMRFQLKRPRGDFQPRYGTMQLVFSSLPHPLMIDGVDAAIAAAVQRRPPPLVVSLISRTAPVMEPTLMDTPIHLTPPMRRATVAEQNKATASLMTTASQGISTGSLIARLCTDKPIESLDWTLMNSAGVRFDERSSVYATMQCTNIIYTSLRPGVYYFRVDALAINEIAVIQSSDTLSVLPSRQVLQCPGKGMIMIKAVEREYTRTRFLDPSGILDTLAPGSIFGFTKPGRYAIELIADEADVIGADGLMIVEDAHYGPEDFVFSVHALPSCGGASDGAIFLAVPDELRHAHIEPFMQFAATVFTGADVAKITIDPTVDSDQGFMGFAISNLPLLRYMIMRVTVDRTCSFTLRYDVPIPDDYYPILHSLEYRPVCSPGSALAHGEIQAYVYDPVSDSNHPNNLLGTHDLHWTFDSADPKLSKHVTTEMSIVGISPESIMAGGKIRLDLRYGKCSTQAELVISPETTPLRHTPTLMIEEVLPIFCPRRNDSQVRVRIAPVSGAHDGVFGELFLDGARVSSEFINPMSGIATLIDIGPGEHVVEYRLNDHGVLECSARASFVVNPKLEYVIARHIEVDENERTVHIDFAADTSDVPEVTHFYADMFNDPEDRKYLADNGHGAAIMSGMPPGHTVSIDIPYPQPPSPPYIRHTSQYCPDPLIIHIPQVLPPSAFRAYDPMNDADWEIYAQPSEQRPMNGELPAPIMIKVRDLNFGTSASNRGETIAIIYPTELILYMIKSEPSIPRYTYAIPNRYRGEFGGPESFMVTVTYDQQNNFAQLKRGGKGAEDRTGVTEATQGLTFVVVRAEAPVPEIYAKHQSEYKFPVAAMSSVPLAAYIHGLEDTDGDVHFYVDGKVCDVRATGFSYWSYKCLFTLVPGKNTSGRRLYLGTSTAASAVSAADTERRSDMNAVERRSTISAPSVFPLKLVCSATALPSSSIAEDGNITIMISGGVAPYTYVWSDLPTAQTGGNTLVRTGVGIGVYSVSIMDSVITASFESAQTCIVLVEDAPSVYSDFYLAGIYASPPVGCGSNASALLIIGVSGTFDPNAATTVAAWNINASETPVTCCGDSRLQPVEIIGMSVNVSVGVGRWNVAACIGGTLVSTGAGVDVFTDPAPLSAVPFSGGETCTPESGPQVIKVPPMIAISGGVYEPLMVVVGSWSGGGSVSYQVVNATAGVLALDSANMSAPGAYSLWLEDARECPTYVVVNISDTGPAPCGSCYVNDTSCYGCDGVPNSGLVYDVCGVCNGTNACLATCTITPLTNLSFAPAEIYACVAAGRTVTGVDAPLISLPVLLPAASMIDIERVPMHTLWAPTGGIAMLISLMITHNFTTGLQTTNLVTPIPSANLTITLIGPTAPSPFPIDTVTMNVQGGSIANATIISRSAGGQKQLVINFVDVPAGGGPALLIPQGALAVYFIQTAFARMALNTTTTAQRVFFSWDNAATSGLAFLDLLLPPAQMNDTTALQNLACTYIAESAGAVKSAGHGAVIMTAQSEYCQSFIAGGGAPTATPVAPYVPGQTAGWFLYGLPLGVVIVVVFGLILYAVFAT